MERNLGAARELATLIPEQNDRAQLENDLATIRIG